MTTRRINKVNNLHTARDHNAMQVAVYESKMKLHTNPDDKIYMNIVIPYAPDSSGLSPASFQQQFNQPILSVPDDYYISIVRFSIPCQNIPIINFANYIQEFPNTDPNLSIFAVTLEYNGGISTSYVSYASETPFMPPGNLSASNPSVNYNNPYYFTYTYSNIISMLNSALNTAFTNLPTKPPTVNEPPAAPYFIYDHNDYRIGLVAQNEFYDEALTTPINVYVNYELFSTFLSGMPSVLFGYNEANEQDVQLLVRNQHNNFYQEPSGGPPPTITNPTEYPFYVMWQDYPTLINMNSFRNLTLQSNLLPIVQEFTVSSSSFESLQNNLSTISSVGIMANFEPIDSFGWESRGIVQYTPTGPYHLINLTGMDPISKIDIRIFWIDQYGQQYPLYLGYNQIVTIKFAFLKKDTFTS
jgi:hypothetical protein